MKRILNFLSILVSLLFIGVVLAQDVSPIQELLQSDWSRVFVETGALAGVLNLLVKLVGNRIPAITGPIKYLAVVVLGLAFGLAGDLGGFLANNEPGVFDGLSYGFLAALTAVGLHQGKAQTEQAFRDSATRRLQG